MSSGVLGRGTYESVIAGVRRTPGRFLFVSSWELLQLSLLQRQVQHNFLVRDNVFHNHFPESAAVNGVFKMTRSQRHAWHHDEVMTAIRRRTFALIRISQQRKLNAELLAEGVKPPSPTPDAAAYFEPKMHKGTVLERNFWQNASRRHLLPRQKWQRHPELGGITRVHNRLAPASSTY